MINDDILKIKVVRDFNKINYTTNILNKHIFKNSYSKEYNNLLELIKNAWFRYVIIPTSKFNFSDLSNIDLDFLIEVAKLKNIEVVSTPRFEQLSIQNSQLFTSSKQVGEIRGINTLKYIKSQSHHTFHIYKVSQRKQLHL